MLRPLVFAVLVVAAGSASAGGLFTLQREPTGTAMTNGDFMCAAARENPENATTEERRAYVRAVCDGAQKQAIEDQQKKAMEGLKELLSNTVVPTPPNLEDRVDDMDRRIQTLENK